MIMVALLFLVFMMVTSIFHKTMFGRCNFQSSSAGLRLCHAHYCLIIIQRDSTELLTLEEKCNGTELEQNG
jgi:hypothetical protein